MLDKYATDSFIIELGAIPDNHDIRVEFSYFMELRKVKAENEFETHRNFATISCKHGNNYVGDIVLLISC